MSPECGDTANVKTIFRRWGDSQEIEMRQYISFSSSDGKMITGKRIDWKANIHASLSSKSGR
jgi:hypothetical protein